MVSMESQMINDFLKMKLIEMGFYKECIMVFDGKEHIKPDNSIYDFIFVGEGNIFEMLNAIKQYKVDYIIKNNVAKGTTYIGSSAGAAMCGVDIKLMVDFDKNIVNLRDLNGFGFFDGVIIPHYNKQQLRRYCRNTPEKDIGVYHNVMNIPQCRLVEIT